MNTRGYSLVEFAIVLLVLALILGFGIPGYKHWIENAEELDERQRAGYSEHAYQMKTGKPCPTFVWQAANIPPDLLELCPPLK